MIDFRLVQRPGRCIINVEVLMLKESSFTAKSALMMWRLESNNSVSISNKLENYNRIKW